jgi:predicted transposase YbfD/YdcC
MEQERSQATITEYFRQLEDPRRYNRRHKLLDILVIAICGAICGADGWEGLELFGETKEEWLRGFLELPHGVPSDDTYRRVFAALDAEQFENCFMDWIEAVEEVTAGQVIAGDGKTLRRSHDRSEDKKALQIVSLWASENGVVLGQMKVDDDSSEMTAVPKLLDTLEIAGCIVTLDALHCQTETVGTIVDKEADYVLPVKENQPRLLEALQGLFDDPEEMHWVRCDYHKTEGQGHGRTEVRECWSTSDPDYLSYIDSLGEWRDLQSIAMVRSERQVGDQTTVKQRYFISSLRSDAKLLLHAVRAHWGIENKVHWVLDVTFREDDCRIRKGNGAENFAVLRHISLNLLRRESSAKRSVKGKRMKAALDDQYLLKVLTG